MLYVLSTLLLASSLTCCQDPAKEPQKTAAYAVPLKNTQVACCAAAVEKALQEHFGPNVSVKDNRAEIKVPANTKVLLSQIQKALEKANEGMGQRMNLTYSIDEARLKLGGATAVFEGTRSEIEKTFPGASVEERDKGRVAVTLDAKSKLTMVELRKAGKLVDVELARSGAACCGSGCVEKADRCETPCGQPDGCKKQCCEPAKEEKKKGCCDK